MVFKPYSSNNGESGRSSSRDETNFAVFAGKGVKGGGGEGASAENGGDLPNEPVHSRQLAWRVELKFGRYFPYLTKYQPRRSSARSDTHIIFKEGTDLLHTFMHLLFDSVQKKVLYCVKQ